MTTKKDNQWKKSITKNEDFDKKPKPIKIKEQAKSRSNMKYYQKKNRRRNKQE